MNLGILILFGAVFLLTAVGGGLFRMSDEQMADQPEKGENAVSFPLISRLSRRAMIVGMAISNLLLACWRYFYYKNDVLWIICWISLCTLLWVCAWTDLKHQLILNRVLLVGLLMRVFLLVFQALMELEGAIYLIATVVIAAIALLLVTLICRLISPKSIGFGDVKLMSLMGFFLGVQGVWNVVFCSMLITFAVSSYLLVSKKAKRNSEMAFAPFLLVGMVTALLILGM